MASPSYNHNYLAHSPPYASSSSLPQPPKRRQTDMPSSAPSIKRRKTSMMSTTSISSLHPLRQTSFPPENNGITPSYSRSPSMDTASLASASVTGAGIKKAKKVRKGKGKENADRARSATVNEGAGGGPKGKRRASRDKSADDTDEERGEVEQGTGLLMAENNKKEENKKRALLTQHMNEEQFARYTAWRSSKLSDNTVRRLVNQTLSQSVPPTVILAIKAATKTFAGIIIEGARKVQTEWLEAEEASNIDPQTGQFRNDKHRNLSTDPKDEKRRGPLLPDHLREAYRRHVLEASGGMAGQLGLWQQQQSGGVERFGVKNRGKVLFK